MSNSTNGVATAHNSFHFHDVLVLFISVLYSSHAAKRIQEALIAFRHFHCVR